MKQALPSPRFVQCLPVSETYRCLRAVKRQKRRTRRDGRLERRDNRIVPRLRGGSVCQLCGGGRRFWARVHAGATLL